MASIGFNVASTSRGAVALATTTRRSLMSSASGMHLRPRIPAVVPATSPAPLRTFIRDSASSWSTSSSSWTSSPPPPSNNQTYGAPQQQTPPPHPLPARVFSNASSSSSSSSSSSTTHPPYSKHFSTTTSLYASHHFDTQAFAQRLEASGISREQADVLTEALRDVIDESISNLAKGLVTREEGDQTNYTQKVDFTRLKSELQLLERNDFALMKSENERLMADVEKLKQRLREEITRTTAGVRLDLNLEKGRIRDESAVHALKIKEVDTRIESEIAGLRTSIQSAKFNVLQYLVGVATGAGALLLAYLRMFR
ncbi:related to middle part of C.elegans myosin heavy chain A [Ustilago trichophora]|uniref:Related to middle part of C.elegans myosin heavy chain A n=1 Tax=Ustilago trichophora TaxID=86804 RepID=A0A5C3E9L6_9BASI|nr:related to middle part of C.elegans myosin heavy chain A [Ustilago trichophora]